MALSRTVLDSKITEIAASGALSGVSNSFTPPDNSLLVVMAGLAPAITTAGTLSVSGGSLTWTIGVSTTPTYFGGSAPDYYGRALIATAPVTTGASMTVTVASSETNGGDLAHIWQSIVAYTGYNVASPTGATASDKTAADDALTITLSGTPANDSEVVACRLHLDNGTVNPSATPNSAWTEIHDLTTAPAGYGSFESMARAAGSTSTSVIWDDTSDNIGSSAWVRHSIALEIKAAPASSIGARVGGRLFAPNAGPRWGLRSAKAFPSASTTITLTADTGAFVLTGQTDLFRINEVVAKGTFTETGIATLFKVSETSAKGTYILSGQSSAFKVDEVVGKGTFVLTGQAAQQARPSPTGSFSLSGKSTAFQFDVPESKGTFVLAGNATNLAPSMVAAKGTFSETGKSAAFKIDEVVDKGTFVLTGRDVILTDTGAAPPPAGGVNNWIVDRLRRRINVQKN